MRVRVYLSKMTSHKVPAMRVTQSLHKRLTATAAFILVVMKCLCHNLMDFDAMLLTQSKTLTFTS